MANDEENDKPGLAEDLAEPLDAALGGSIVGAVQGLIWSDSSGIDIVSVSVRDVAVAVPVESDAWRDVHVVELNISPAELTDAPQVQDLEASGGAGAVRAVADYYSMPLSGPPPGPPTGPLPPWWHTQEAHAAGQDADPTPLIG